MEIRTMRCPKCNGDGFVSGCVKPGPNGTMRPTKETCSRCDGDGEVKGRSGAPKPPSLR